MKILKQHINTSFMDRYETDPITVLSPGRINIIGEHTDYSNGLILSAAIDKHVTIVARINNSNVIQIESLDYNESFKIDLNKVEKKQNNSWLDFINGIIKELRKKEIKLNGFDCTIKSNVPIGSGLSSSAALCCGLIKAIDAIFGLGFTNWEIVYLAQAVENNHIGVQSGFMDQFTSVFGKKDKCLFLNCETKEHEEIECDFGEYKLVLINSKVKHNHSVSGYNSRPQECLKALEILNHNFRELSSISDLKLDELSAVKSLLTPLLYKRVSYVVEENQRVLFAREAFETKSMSLLGSLLYESHAGLKDKYNVSCDEVDFLVEQTKNIPEILGARMMGGGFGGCTINLIKKNSKKVIDLLVSSQSSIDG